MEHAVIGRGSKYVLWLLGFLLAVSALQYLWIAFFWYPGDLSRWRAAAAEQKPVHIRIKCTDQFGKPATNFRLGIKVVWISWYDWLLPLWAQHESTYQIETDHDGKAKFSFLIRKAYSVEFKEGSTDRYIFPNGKRDPYELSFNNNPTGPLDMTVLDRTGQVIDMRVLRHDPPVKLIRYRPEVPGWGPKVISSSDAGMPAQDEMVFTMDITGNRFLPGRQDGDIVLTVTNAKEACKAAWDRLMHESTFEEKVPLQVTLESQKGTELQQADMQIVTFAPKEGYKHSLVYQMTIEKAPPSGWPRADSPEDWYRLLESTPAEVRYQVMFGAGGIDRGIFLRGTNASWYGILHIMVDLQPKEGKLLVRTSGAYNPTGSRNLWTGAPLLPERY